MWLSVREGCQTSNIKTKFKWKQFLGAVDVRRINYCVCMIMYMLASEYLGQVPSSLWNPAFALYSLVLRIMTTHLFLWFLRGCGDGRVWELNILNIDWCYSRSYKLIIIPCVPFYWLTIYLIKCFISVNKMRGNVGAGNWFSDAIGAQSIIIDCGGEQRTNCLLLANAIR